MENIVNIKLNSFQIRYSIFRKENLLSYRINTHLNDTDYCNGLYDD